MFFSDVVESSEDLSFLEVDFVSYLIQFSWKKYGITNYKLGEVRETLTGRFSENAHN